MIEIEDNEASDAAFSDSAGQIPFAEITLHPFSYARQRAAWALGMRIGTPRADFTSHPNPKFQRKREVERALKAKKPPKDEASLRAELKTLAREGPEILIYDGISEDAAIAAFVRALPDSEVAKVRRQTTTYEDKFEEWVDANGLGINGRNESAALKEFIETLNQINASRSDPVLPKSDKEDASPNV